MAIVDILFPLAASLFLAAAVHTSIQLFTAILAEYRRAQSLKNIRGPPSSSWLFGNLLEMHIPKEYGEVDNRWLQKFGPVYRIKAGFGRDRLMVADPLALQSILHSEDFVSAPARQAFLTWIFDIMGQCGILALEGPRHRTLRAALNIGFTTPAAIARDECKISTVDGTKITLLCQGPLKSLLGEGRRLSCQTPIKKINLRDPLSAQTSASDRAQPDILPRQTR
uniref:Cytochrome P450 n=1 Tax=Mycena chlorophos TaxID=658473 RepID=A0ABQ0M7A5_MYCCL|nr:cytochrome P450 [Mycena chlorophos]